MAPSPPCLIWCCQYIRRIYFRQKALFTRVTYILFVCYCTVSYLLLSGIPFLLPPLPFGHPSYVLSSLQKILLISPNEPSPFVYALFICISTTISSCIFGYIWKKIAIQIHNSKFTIHTSLFTLVTPVSEPAQSRHLHRRLPSWLAWRFEYFPAQGTPRLDL